MAIMQNKKGFVFTFLALFIVMVIYMYAQINLDTKTYSLYNDFEEARISSVDREITYFKTSYLKDSLEISLDATLKALINKSQEESFYQSYNSNYSVFNNLVYEGITQGSFYGESQPLLEEKTITYLVDSFEDSFNSKRRSDFSFTPINVVVFEQQPFYVSLQLTFRIETTMKDNLSTWNLTETVTVNRPVYSLYDPIHYISYNLTNSSPELQSVESRYSANVNWSLPVFNETISQQFSTVYTDPIYKYSLGTSFLRGLLNSTSGSYKDVVGFWSFDYDEEEQGVYDSSNNINKGIFYENSRLILNFDNSSDIIEKSPYDYSFVIEGANWDDNNCVFGGCYEFNETTDQIRIEDPTGLNFGSSNFSISLWFNPKNSSEANQRLISIGEYNNSGYEIILDNLGDRILFRTYKDDTRTLVTSFPIEQYDKWNHLVIRKYEDEADIYLNGRETQTQGSVFEAIKNPHLEYNFTIGKYFFNDINYSYEGKIDEIAMFTNKISKEEIARLYEAKKAEILAYKDTYHTKGIYLDGVDDRVEINDIGSNYTTLFQDDFTVELWFTPKGEIGDLINYRDEFALSYDLNAKELYLNDYDSPQNIPIELSTQFPNYVTITYNQSSSSIDVFHNGKIIYESSQWNADGDGTSFLRFGRTNMWGTGVGENFVGTFDEIRFLNSTTSKEEVLKRYYNYKSEAKGCCNYLLPINPQKTGFNSSSYSDETSYSTTIFNNYYFNNNPSNLTLYNVTNITSSQTNEEYYNFLVDVCMLLVYDIFSYDEAGNAAQRINVGDDNGECRELIRKGIY